MAGKSSKRGVSVEIFCESGQEMGLGHLYRCIKLARICAQIPEIATITLHNRGDFAPDLSKIVPRELRTRIHFFTQEWLSYTHKPCPAPSLTIIDSYQANRAFYTLMQQRGNALICLDDTLRDIYPAQSYILNPTPEARTHFASKPYYLWCGEEYAIVPQYAQVKPRPQLVAPSSTRHIFVNFGGVDSRDLTQAFISALAALESAFCLRGKFHIVLGGGYTHKLHLPALRHNRVHIYRDLSPDAFLSLAQACDYAISAGGGSMLELLGLKIPSIILESAPNQRSQIAHFEKKGAIIQATDAQNALSILTNLLANTSQTQAIKIALESLQLGSALEAALQDLAQALLISTPKPLAPM